MKGFGSVSHVPDWRLSRALGVEQHKTLWNHCHGTEGEDKMKMGHYIHLWNDEKWQAKVVKELSPTRISADNTKKEKKVGKYSRSVKQRNTSLEEEEEEEEEGGVIEWEK